MVIKMEGCNKECSALEKIAHRSVTMVFGDIINIVTIVQLHTFSGSVVTTAPVIATP